VNRLALLRSCPRRRPHPTWSCQAESRRGGSSFAGGMPGVCASAPFRSTTKNACLKLQYWLPQGARGAGRGGVGRSTGRWQNGRGGRSSCTCPTAVEIEPAEGGAGQPERQARSQTNRTRCRGWSRRLELTPLVATPLVSSREPLQDHGDRRADKAPTMSGIGAMARHVENGGLTPAGLFGGCRLSVADAAESGERAFAGVGEGFRCTAGWW
jgi:hypothetical protein